MGGMCGIPFTNSYYYYYYYYLKYNYNNMMIIESHTKNFWKQNCSSLSSLYRSPSLPTTIYYYYYYYSSTTITVVLILFVLQYSTSISSTSISSTSTSISCTSISSTSNSNSTFLLQYYSIPILSLLACLCRVHGSQPAASHLRLLVLPPPAPPAPPAPELVEVSSYHAASGGGREIRSVQKNDVGRHHVSDGQAGKRCSKWKKLVIV
jgi:hypothetical protein